MGTQNHNLRKWTRAEVVDSILAGEILFIRNGHVIKVPKVWLDRHPGGELAISHFVGRDASDETSAFHSSEALEKMMHFAVGTVDVDHPVGWNALVPPIMLGWVHENGLWSKCADATNSKHINSATGNPITQILLMQKHASKHFRVNGLRRTSLEPFSNELLPEIQRRHSIEYHRLHTEIVNSGLYKTHFISGYGPELFRYLLLAMTSIFAYKSKWFISSAVLLGMLWHQLTFTAHDLGHNGVTHSWVFDRILGIVVADLLGGLSIGWWVDVSIASIISFVFIDQLYDHIES